MHSGDLVELGGSDLTEVEKETLLEVMQRAKVYGNTLPLPLAVVYLVLCVCVPLVERVVCCYSCL